MTTIETTPATLPVLDAEALDPGLLGDARRLSAVLNDLIRVIQFRDRDRACCYDVSVSQCYALKGVVDAGALTVNDLAALLYLDKSTASRIANGLVDKELIRRQRAPTDGRVVLLVPTAAGRDVHARIEADLAREYMELLADFDPEVRVAMTTLLSRLGRSFGARVEASGGSCCVVS